MNYAELIDQGIREAKLSNSKIVLKLHEKGINVDRTLISKLRNGKYTSTKIEFNLALAEILKIDPDILKVAALKEKMPAETVELIKKMG